jgi:ubiquinone/menaquinone biosynthesis C-methylase UbiE
MAHPDPYRDLAARYDWMARHDPLRDGFFQSLFTQHNVQSVLDCACGTGADLVLFARLGCQVQGSDLSAAMLAQAEKRLAGENLKIPLFQADFRHLPDRFDAGFDAVVCLSNAINEVLDQADVVTALRSMRNVLRPGGILVLDQGQTDASLADPPRLVPVVNERDFSRLFAIDYSGDLMDVHICDFVHTAEVTAFHQSTVRLRIRLQDDWLALLQSAGLGPVELFGDWQFAPYNKATSRRLVLVAQR